MKICHVVDALNIGGLEKTVIEIVQGLSCYTHEVWCLRRKGVLAEGLEIGGVVVREFGFSGRMTRASISSLAEELREGHFDIIHSHGAHPAMWGEIAAWLAGVRVRIDHVQNMVLFFPFNQRLRLKALSYRATKIIAVSEAVKRSLIDTMWIDPARIDVIYNAAPDLLPCAAYPRSGVRKELGIEDGDFVVGSVGRLEQHKGHTVLLDAIAEVRRFGLGPRCVIIGDGPMMSSLADRAAHLGLGNTIIFTGWRHDVGELMRAMDVYVQPSTLIEGLPLVLAEASSCALPLIATNIGGNPEIAEQGVNGFIVPPKDSGAIAQKIMCIMKNPAAAKKMGESSRRAWQEKFSQKRMVWKIKDLYDRYVF